MFNNLIESSSHRREFKRRGSFFLFTTATYALLFAIAGVVSIYAYDARLEDQNTEIVTLLSPVDFSTQAPATPHITNAPKGNSTKQAFYERKAPMVSVAHPEIAPDKISTTPNVYLPLPDAGIIKFSGRDVDLSVPDGSGGPGDGVRQTNSSRAIVPVIEIPPPAMVQKPVPKVIDKKIINSEAIELPKPPYPPMAKEMHVQGMVSVQVLIDETGKVISAKAVSGSPFLTAAAQRAAYRARFSPTLIDDQPVKVSGVITYNFVLQ
jgi:TonB family protein